MKLLWKNKRKLSETESQWIKRAIQCVLRLEGLTQDGELSISILEDEEIRIVNRDHRGVDKSTDVLSFPQVESLEEAKEMPYLVLGDMLLNVKKMKEQALEYGHSSEREISYLTVHSLYHLLGYDHEDEESKKEMRAKEEEALRRLELS